MRPFRWLLLVAALFAVLAMLSPLPGLSGAPPTAGPPNLARNAPVALATQTLLPAHPAAPASTELHATGSPMPVPSRASPTATVPKGAVLETPAPAVPDTTPLTFVLLSQSRTPTVTQFVNVSSASWQLILLNYTGEAVNGVYDSSYYADVAGVPVLFGTTPEYGQWTVLKDITEYESLFQGNVSVQFDLGTAVTTGYFLTSFSISFYPVPAGGTPPPEPTQIVPLWPYTSEVATAPNTTVVRTVPTDVVNATLEVYAYGFTGGPDDEEFWYTLTPPYRTIQAQVDNTTFASILPFPYINTGGIDLFAWDPITGAFTLDDRPYQVSVSAALGMLEGTHSFKLQAVGRLPQARWIAGGALLLYTSSSAGPASLTEYHAPSATYLNSSVTGGRNENVSVDYSYGSAIPSGSGTTDVNAWTNESFDGQSTSISSGSGTTQVLNSTTTQSEWTGFAERSTSPGGAEWVNGTARYHFSLNESELAEGTGATGTDLNETVHVGLLHQEWNESRLDTDRSATAVHASGDSFDDSVNVNANYRDEEYIVSPGAAEIVTIYDNFENTSKTYHSSVTSSPLVAYYNHTLEGQLASPTAPQENVTLNTQAIHPAVGLSETRATTDAGQTDLLTATTLGAGAPYSFTWSGLPPGCPRPTGSTLRCAGNASGTFEVSVTIVPTMGDTVVSAPIAWTILPDPAATVTLTPASVDFGQTADLTATVSGGLGPYRCAWEADGLLLAPATPCELNLTYTPDSVANVTISLNVTDAFGVTSTPSTATLAVTGDPTVVLSVTPPSGTVTAGSPVTIEALAWYGTAPYRFAWTSNGAAVTSGVSGANYTFTPTAAGTYTIGVTATDARGYEVVNSATVTVTAATVVPPPNNGSSSSNVATLELVGVGLLVVLLAAALLAILLRRRGRP
jgi:hypothetical protein